MYTPWKIEHPTLEALAAGERPSDPVIARCIMGCVAIVGRALDEPHYWPQFDERMSGNALSHLRDEVNRLLQHNSKAKQEALDAVDGARRVWSRNFYSEFAPLRATEPVWGHSRLPALSRSEWQLFKDCAERRPVLELIKDYAVYELKSEDEKRRDTLEEAIQHAKDTMLYVSPVGAMGVALNKSLDAILNVELWA